MAKNEIHARLSPQTIEQLKQFTKAQNLPTISHAVRCLIDIAFKAVNDELQFHQKNDDIVQLIEQECQVFFARCRDKYDPEDGNFYWFWFESEGDDNSWIYDADSPNNWCPVKRFNSRGEAIRDCLREKVNQVDSAIILDSLPTLSFVTSDSNDVIDW